MNIDRMTTVVELIDQVRALDTSGGGKDGMFFQRLMIEGQESTIAIGTGEAGRLIETVLCNVLKARGMTPDQRGAQWPGGQ